MPGISGSGLSLPAKAQTSGAQQGPLGFANELLVSELMGKYATLVKAGKVFAAMATVTAPVIFSTAAGTGGPLIWNRPGSNLDAHILGVSFGAYTTATAVAGAIGLAAGVGQTIAPTTTTAIDAIGNMLVGGPVTGMGGVFRIGTVSNAGSQFFPLIAAGTGAITAIELAQSWIDVGGAMIITPGTWGALSASATLTAAVVSLGLLWAELPA